MKYSYIKYRKKTIFTQKVKTLFIVFYIIIFILFSIYVFFIFQDYKFSKQLQQILAKTTQLETQIDKLNKQIKHIKQTSIFYEKIYTKNILLKDSIKNIFNLVPQQIVLSKAIISDSMLILEGVTQSKSIYNSMLQTPLSYIYTEHNNSIIYHLKNTYFFRDVYMQKSTQK